MTACHWCGNNLGTRRARIFVLPKEYSQRKLHFHKGCVEKFKSANPNIMRQKQQEALQGVGYQ